jgi:hypothetical protein
MASGEFEKEVVAKKGLISVGFFPSKFGSLIILS